MSDVGASTLALLVLHQATLDACGICAGLEAASISTKRPSTTRRDRAIAEARLFWTAESGPWAEAREMWCDAAGIHPDHARRVALKRITSASSYGPEMREFVQLAATGKVNKGGRRASPEVAERRARIKELHAQGLSVKELAERFGMSTTRVYDALSGKR